MSVKLLTEYHLEFLSLKGGCTGSSKSIHVKMPYCWKSHVAAQLCVFYRLDLGLHCLLMLHKKEATLNRYIYRLTCISDCHYLYNIYSIFSR